MDDQDWQRVKQVVADALERAGDARSRFLDDACGEDLQLRAQVEALLAAHAEAGEFLASPTMEHERDGADDDRERGTVVLPGGESAGATIGPYKLLQLIGEGGFGSVFMAEQEKPVHRRVALKIIKLGMDTRQVIARFEAERQALAMMDHPNIARVLDAGATQTGPYGGGRPYFVMELVKGEPVTEYCDKNNLTIAERLDLFVQVCHAVQHAHQKGVIHRDLKPSNILVSTQDGRAFAKVIDFGIAKATAARLTERTLFTEHKALIGTPEYMSPEQAEGSMDIDTRTDVYSLGVLLYELLTGSTPFEGESLRSAAYAEIQRIIREVEPPKPSTRLSQSTETLPGVAAHRRMEPGRLGSLVKGDLDWIVMKSLEKDRQRRYETANDLAADVQRHLSGEAVLAAPPSKAYRMRKFVRRNRAAVIGGSTIAAVLILGIISTSASTLWAVRERTRANREAADAIVQKEEARRNEVLATQREGEIRKVAEFQSFMLQQVRAEEIGRQIQSRLRFEIEAGLRRELIAGSDGTPRGRTDEEIAAALTQFDQAIAPGNATDVARSVMDASVLTPAIEAIQDEFADQPGVEASLRHAIGEMYQYYGNYGKAEEQYRRAIELRRELHGPEHVSDLALSLSRLADLHRERGKHAEAEALLREALELVGTQDTLVKVRALTNLARLCQDRGDYAGAEPLFEEALALNRKLQGNDHSDVATSVYHLSQVAAFKGDYVRAALLIREALVIWRVKLGDEDRSVAIGLAALGTALYRQGEYQEAENSLRASLAIARRMMGENHVDVTKIINSLGLVLHAKGDLPGAEAMFRDVLEAARVLRGSEHSDVAAALNNLALVLEDQGDHAGAEALYRESLTLVRKLLGDDHPYVADAMSNLGGLLRRRGDHEGAEPLMRQALAIRRGALGPDHPKLAQSLAELAQVLAARGESRAAAEQLYRDALAIYRKAPGKGYPTVAVRSDLVALLQKGQDLAGVEELLVEALEDARQNAPPDDAAIARAVMALALNLLEQRKFVEAEPLLREGIGLAERSTADRQLATLRRHVTLVRLGECLSEQGRFAESEPLLLEVYAGFTSDAEARSTPATADAAAALRIRQVVGSLILLYERWTLLEPGKADAAALWRARLAALPPQE